MRWQILALRLESKPGNEQLARLAAAMHALEEQANYENDGYLDSDDVFQAFERTAETAP